MSAGGQPTEEQVLAALERNGMRVADVTRYELRPDGWLLVQLDGDGGVMLPPADLYPNVDCFGRVAPHAECIGVTSCPRRRACSE